jgi:CRP-like cAMP-binding protein
MTDLLQLLKAHTLFNDLPDALLNPIIPRTRYHEIERGEMIFRQGEESSLFFLIVQGRVRLIQHTLDGKEVTMAVFAPGEAVGLIVSLIGEPYSGSAEALEDTVVLSLPGTILWQIMTEHHGLAIRVVRMLAARLHDAHNRIRELSTERVNQRIARSTLRLAEKLGVHTPTGAIRLDLSLSRQDLAQMSGTTLETVSRTLTSWEHRGIVNAGREQLTILKFDELLLIAQGLSAIAL